MEEVTLTANKNYYLQLNQKHVKLSAPKQSVNTIYSPKGYTIAGLTQYTLSNEQYVEIDLDHNTKTWNIINGIPPHNSLQGLQGGSPGQYYHLTKAQWVALTNSSGTIGTETVFYQDLNVGDNTVTHGLGAIPVIITFWNMSTGVQFTLAPNILADPTNNYFTVNCSRAYPNTRIYVRAFGTS